MKTRTYVTIVTALLIMAMAGSAMCTPDANRVASHEEQKKIDAIQKAIDEKGHKWTAGTTSVSNLTKEEKMKMCGAKPYKEEKSKMEKAKKPKKYDIVGTSPAVFDWRNNGGGDWTTPVRNQGSCGSCTAFAAVGVVEAAINIHANDPTLDIDLSEQHLISDCCSAVSCIGGMVYPVMEYIRNNGVPNESCFPYIASNCACTPCDGWENSIMWDVESIEYDFYEDGCKNIIFSNGPAVGRMVVYDDFMSYNSGVYEYSYGEKVGTHAIIVVGWNDTEDSWIIKNSWGSGWGENGYARIRSFLMNSAGVVTVDSMNFVPTADVSANVQTGTTPLNVAFTGTGTDSDGTIVSYTWTFGDGASSTAQNPTHTYTNGTYTATLTVTDDNGATGTDSVEIVVLEYCQCDLTGNGVVDDDDVNEAVANWGSCSGCEADLNDDGYVDIDDLFIIMDNYGNC